MWELSVKQLVNLVSFPKSSLFVKHLFPIISHCGYPLIRGFSSLCNNFKLDSFNRQSSSSIVNSNSYDNLGTIEKSKNIQRQQQYIAYIQSLDLLHIKSELYNKMDELERYENIDQMGASVLPEIFARKPAKDETDNRQENKSLVSSHVNIIYIKK